MTRRLIALAALGALGLAGQASAHARLVSSDPAANATVAAPKQLSLHFSESLKPKFSGLTVTMPSMSNMKAAVKVAVAKDGKTLVATTAAPLAPGHYKVSWHAVSADTHRIEGSYSFTVR